MVVVPNCIGLNSYYFSYNSTNLTLSLRRLKCDTKRNFRKPECSCTYLLRYLLNGFKKQSWDHITNHLTGSHIALDKVKFPSFMASFGKTKIRCCGRLVLVLCTIGVNHEVFWHIFLRLIVGL